MLLNSRNVYNKLIFDVGITAFELNDTLQIEELRKELSVDEYFGIIWSGSKKFIHKINGKEYSIPKNHFLFIAPNISQEFVKQTTRTDAYYIVFKQEFYYTLRQANFDYIIKDYGVYEGEDFEKYSFLEQDIKIVVGGIKANEIFLLEKVLKDRSYKMYYILNFVPQYEKACVEDLFLDEKERVFFSPIILDMFDLYVKNDNFKFIIGI